MKLEFRWAGNNSWCDLTDFEELEENFKVNPLITVEVRKCRE